MSKYFFGGLLALFLLISTCYATSPEQLKLKALGTCKQHFNKNVVLKNKFSKSTSCRFKVILEQPTNPTIAVIKTEPIQVHIYAGTNKKLIKLRRVVALSHNTNNFNGRVVKFKLQVPARKHFKVRALSSSGQITVDDCPKLESQFSSTLELGRACIADIDCMDGEMTQALSNGSCNCDDFMPLNLYADVGALNQMLAAGLALNCRYANNFMFPQDMASICICNEQKYSCINNVCSR